MCKHTNKNSRKFEKKNSTFGHWAHKNRAKHTKTSFSHVLGTMFEYGVCPRLVFVALEEKANYERIRMKALL